MNTGMKIGAAVAGGYVLGRRRKAKLAVGLATWLVGKKLNLDPKKLVLELGHELSSSPEIEELRRQVRTELLTAGKTAANTLLTAQTNRLADSLHARTERLTTSLPTDHADVVTAQDEAGDEDDVDGQGAKPDGEPGNQGGTRQKARSAGDSAKRRSGTTRERSPRDTAGTARSAGSATQRSGNSGASRTRSVKGRSHDG